MGLPPFNPPGPLPTVPTILNIPSSPIQYSESI